MEHPFCSQMPGVQPSALTTGVDIRKKAVNANSGMPSTRASYLFDFCKKPVIIVPLILIRDSWCARSAPAPVGGGRSALVVEMLISSGRMSLPDDVGESINPFMKGSQISDIDGVQGKIQVNISIQPPPGVTLREAKSMRATVLN